MPARRTRRKRRPATHHARNAGDFLAVLSPVNGLLAQHWEPDEHIYRGHATTQFQLIPSVFRKRAAAFLMGRSLRGRRTMENQIRAEIRQIYKFFMLADARGLRLPEDSQQLRKTLQRCLSYEFIKAVANDAESWPPDNLLSLLALAQHYGIPTRLLDWSRHPYVAAYFAASSAVANRRAGRLAVWAFASGTVFGPLRDNERYVDWQYYERISRRVTLVTAPAADIPNLFAQHGVFMLLKDRKFRPSAPFHALPYDEIFLDMVESEWDRPLFYRFTLPAQEASELLCQLTKLGIDASTIYPGYDGVARALREREKFPSPDGWDPAVLQSRETYGDEYYQTWDQYQAENPKNRSAPRSRLI